MIDNLSITLSDVIFPKIVQFYYPSKRIGLQGTLSAKYKFVKIRKPVNLYRFYFEFLIDQND